MRDTLPVDSTSVIRGLWISDEAAAYNRSFLVKRKIKTILNISDSTASSTARALYRRLGIGYIRLELTDTEDCSQKVFENVMRAGLTALKSSKFPALVHCTAGVNRSAAIITYFMMHAKGWSYDCAIQRMEMANAKRCDSCLALTNQRFRELLQISDQRNNNCTKTENTTAHI